MEKDSAIYKIRHSLAHVLADAVLELYPHAQCGSGPATDTGFFYGFDFTGGDAPGEEDLKQIEKKMRHLLKQSVVPEQETIPLAEALERFKDSPYKTEILKEKGEKNGDISVYTIGKFSDPCSGPHVAATKEIDVKGFRLERIAGAYWKGDEKNPMLTRIYGLAFENAEKLAEYDRMQKEAKERDHRKIGQEQQLFFIDDMVGKGLVMWLPKGNIIKAEIEKFAIESEKAAGYQHISTPHIAKEELFLTSGHLPYYKEDMYPSMEMDDGTYYLKAMNCPHHHRIYQHLPKSYRDFPVRYAEYGMVYRNERSGTLAGLLRVRGLDMNDAHIYCRKDQIKEEFKSVMELTQKYFKTFELEDYWFRLSKWDSNRKEKYFDEPESWEYCQDMIREALEEMEVKFVEVEDEAAFYGPKVDVQFKSVTGREESMSTIQLDFIAKERFGLEYVDETGQKNNEVFVIHRAPLSTHERFLAFIIEHYAGNFPLWLAPEQVAIIPVAENHKEYASTVADTLQKEGVRVHMDTGNDSMGKKIRYAKKNKLPYFIVIGDKEVEAKNVTLESRNGETETLSLEDLTARLSEEIKNKDLTT